MTDNSLVGKLEALLFIAPMGVTPAQLAEALQVSRNKVEEGISELLAHYTSHASMHGLRIQSRLIKQSKIIKNKEGHFFDYSNSLIS